MTQSPSHLPTDPFDADNAPAPAHGLLLREWWSLVELLASHLARLPHGHWSRGDGHPVLVLPGFLANDGSTWFLRRLLDRLGYAAYGWEQGLNLGPRDGLADRVRERLHMIADRHGEKVSLVGWSAGGIYARELAREQPDQVRSVITLGSPFRGNHTNCHSWRMFKLIHPDADSYATPDARRSRAQHLDVPTSCIYSRLDGLVPWQCCTSLPGPFVENIEVDSTHLGFGHHLETLYIICDRLAQPEGGWRPYTGSGRGGWDGSERMLLPGMPLGMMKYGDRAGL